MDTLAEEGIEVDGLACAEDALVLLGAGQVPDVLVADIDLGPGGPGLGGLDLAAIGRERHPGFAVVLISGTVPNPGPRHALGRRERFLRKPFAPAALAEAIRGAASAAAAIRDDTPRHARKPRGNDAAGRVRSGDRPRAAVRVSTSRAAVPGRSAEHRRPRPAPRAATREELACPR